MSTNSSKYVLVVSKGTLHLSNCSSLKLVDNSNKKRFNNENEAFKFIGTKLHKCQRCLKNN